MIITAALPWYDELPEDLEACIAGVANVADNLIALDGSYRRYPNAKVRSPRAQVDAIYGAARNVGLDCTVVLPDRLWLGQVEKRTELLKLATAESDWICLVDTDHIVSTDRNTTRSIIEQTPSDICVWDAKYITPNNLDKDFKDSAAGKWHIAMTKASVFIPHILRSLPDMRVERFHWWYSAMKGGSRVWVFNPDTRVNRTQKEYGFVTHKRLDNYTVEHRCLFRDQRHVLEGRAFCNDREMVVKLTGQEDDMPGLPRPVFDYERQGL